MRARRPGGLALAVLAAGAGMSAPAWTAGLAWGAPNAAATATAATGSPTPSAEDVILGLPAYDLERVDGLERMRVGDSVIARIDGLTRLPGVQEPMRELRLEALPGGESLTDLGWDVRLEESGGAAPDEFRLRATPLKSGRMVLPSLAIVRATKGEEKPAPLARTNPIEVEVESAIPANDPDKGKPADLRPPVSLLFPWWLIAAGALAFAALVAAGIVGYRRWRASQGRSASVKPVEPPKPEDEVALAALAALEGKNGPLHRGEFKSHYFRVSEILKAYIGRRYEFDAAESTTREMIAQLESRHVMEDARLDRLESLFEKLDLVKFTDHVPLPDEGMMVLEVAREFVRATRRPPTVLPPAGQASVPGRNSGLSMGGTMR